MKHLPARSARLVALAAAATMSLAGAVRAADSQWVYKVVATNDLGMHCVDADFSVFSILPPYNVFNAQVVRRGSTGKPVVVNDSVVSIRYEAIRDAAGSINSSSIHSALGPKTNFWTYAKAIYGATLQPGQGLKGLYMPADATTTANRSMSWNLSDGLFKAEGVPIMPTDDAGLPNRYPLMRLVATEKATGRDVATLDIDVTAGSDLRLTKTRAPSGQLIVGDPDQVLHVLDVATPGRMRETSQDVLFRRRFGLRVPELDQKPQAELRGQLAIQIQLQLESHRDHDQWNQRGGQYVQKSCGI